MFNRLIMTILAACAAGATLNTFALPSFLTDNAPAPKSVTVGGDDSAPTTTTVLAPAPAASNSTSDNNAQASAGSTAAPADVTSQLLNASINRLSQNAQMTQQLDMQQMQTLQQQNRSLQEEISKLTQAMTIMHQQVTSLGSEVATLSSDAAKLQHPAVSNVVLASSPAATSSNKVWNSFLHSVYFKIATGIIALLLLGLFWKLTARKNNSQPTKLAAEHDSTSANTQDAADGDYDFLNSDDAIPAKLDLARAYIAMEDYAAAKVVLNDVLMQGDTEQKNDAQAILDQIKQKTTTSV